MVTAGTVDDQQRMVMYDSGHTNLIIVCIDNASFKAAEGGPEATLSSASTGECSQKWKDKKKRCRCHSSVSSSPGGKLARYQSASFGREGGLGPFPFPFSLWGQDCGFGQ